LNKIWLKGNIVDLLSKTKKIAHGFQKVPDFRPIKPLRRINSTAAGSAANATLKTEAAAAPSSPSTAVHVLSDTKGWVLIVTNSIFHFLKK